MRVRRLIDPVARASGSPLPFRSRQFLRKGETREAYVQSRKLLPALNSEQFPLRRIYLRSQVLVLD